MKQKLGLPLAPLSLTSTCSDMVSLEEEEAVRRLEYNTQHIHTIRPTIDSESKLLVVGLTLLPPEIHTSNNILFYTQY